MTRVNMSQVCAPRGRQSHAIYDHWLTEAGHRLVRPTVAHLLLHSSPSRAGPAPNDPAGLLHVPFGTGRHPDCGRGTRPSVIVGSLEDPASSRGKIYPLYGPVDFTTGNRAGLIRCLGKDVHTSSEP